MISVHIAFDPTAPFIRAVECVANRTEAAAVYARALADGRTNWGRLNRAILQRWTFSGLEFIKQRAWAIVERDAEVKT